MLCAGFVHSAFTFGQESFITASEIRPASVPPGYLVSVLQRGLQYAALEAHINEDGSERPCSRPFNLLETHVCDDNSASTLTDTVDAPLNSSVSSLNLAVQNASVMATNAVYGTAMTATSSAAPSSTTASAATTTAATATTAGAKKRARKEKSSAAAAAAQAGDTLELVAHNLEISGLAWNPEMPVLASASADSTVRLFSFPAGAFESGSGLCEVNPRSVVKNSRHLEHVLFREGNRNHDVTCLDWRRDGSLLATGCYDGKARIWTAQGDLVKTLQRHSGPIFTVRWSPSGRFLLTGGVDGVVIVWDAAESSGTVRHQLTHHTASCLDTEWLDEARFVTVSSDRTGLLFDLSKADGTAAEGTLVEPIGRLEGHFDEVNTCRFDPHSGLIATCSDDHTARIWKGTECTALAKGHEKEIYTLKWSPAGFLFATASFDHSVLIWNAQPPQGSGLMLAEGQQQQLVPMLSLEHHTAPVYSLAWSPCGRFLATGSLDESVAIWQLDSNLNKKDVSDPSNVTISLKPAKVHNFSAAGGVYDLDWRESWIAAGMADGRVVVIEFSERSIEVATNSTAATSASASAATAATTTAVIDPLDPVGTAPIAGNTSSSSNDPTVSENNTTTASESKTTTTDTTAIIDTPAQTSNNSSTTNVEIDSPSHEMMQVDKEEGEVSMSD